MLLILQFIYLFNNTLEAIKRFNIGSC